MRRLVFGAIIIGVTASMLWLVSPYLTIGLLIMDAMMLVPPLVVRFVRGKAVSQPVLLPVDPLSPKKILQRTEY